MKYKTVLSAGKWAKLIACMHLQPDIKPFMLDFWLNSLLLAVAECDREYTPRTQTIWRKVMSPGVEFVKNYLEVTESKEKTLQAHNLLKS